MIRMLGLPLMISFRVDTGDLLRRSDGCAAAAYIAVLGQDDFSLMKLCQASQSLWSRSTARVRSEDLVRVCDPPPTIGL